MEQREFQTEKTSFFSVFLVFSHFFSLICITSILRQTYFYPVFPCIFLYFM